MINSGEYLRKGHIHPIDVLKAFKTYLSGGQLGRSQKTWQPVPHIVDILEPEVGLVRTGFSWCELKKHAARDSNSLSIDPSVVFGE